VIYDLGTAGSDAPNDMRSTPSSHSVTEAGLDAKNVSVVDVRLLCGDKQRIM